MSSRIKQLDSVTVNKIAAGEVIDRPVSIIKELIENAIDAGATKIQITIKNGGKELIRITDNGHGFYNEDLKKAPLRHATSKINKIEDIYDSHSFGFRGEALASICHCAKLSIFSKSKDEAQAFSIHAFQDEISDLKPCSHNDGTTIEVKDLFFNIPVREQFLKTPATEASHCLECCMHFALMHTDKSFIFTSDDTERLNSTGVSKLEDLIVLFYGKSLKEHLVPVDERIGPVHISGIVSAPPLTFPNRQKQVTAVNNRLIKNALIQKSLSDSYRDLIPHRRFPLAILKINIQKDSLDVNVHPQKQDVKFINPGFVFDVIPKAISLALQSHSAHSDLIKTQIYASSTVQPGVTVHQQIPTHTPSGAQASFQQVASVASEHFQPFSTVQTEQQGSLSFSAPVTSLEYLQVFNTYIILKSTQGVYMIDQHAVHERILYEQIKESFSKEQSRQLLLVPEIMDISSDLMTLFESVSNFFKDLNFVCDIFGPNQLIIREVPLLFQKASVKDLISDILEQLKAIPGSSRSLTAEQKDVLQRQACRAAIKAGQSLNEQEVRQLCKDFIESPQNYSCPHGRPLYIHFDKSKLEHLFMRV